MAKYRLLEITDNLINKGKPFWILEKKIFGLWWSDHFEEHSEFGNTFYDYDEAIKWYEYHVDPPSRRTVEIIAHN